MESDRYRQLSLRYKDGLARSAVIRTSSGLTNRPIVKLYPLEINQNGESDETDELMIRKSKIRANEKIRQWTK